MVDKAFGIESVIQVHHLVITLSVRLQVLPGHPFGSFVVNTGKVTGLRIKESNRGSTYSQEISLSNHKKADIADPQLIKVLLLFSSQAFWDLSLDIVL